jgi:UDP-N-acetylglucosamine acyltransferase
MATSVDIHATAVVDPRAELAVGVSVGPYAVIGPHVIVGPRTTVGAQVILDGAIEIGADCVIHPSAVIGTPPQDLKYRGARSSVCIGDRTVIREMASINRATGDGEATVIGSDAYVMIYAHVAHNCRVGDHVILANAVQMAGHVTIDEWAAIGGSTAVHQFVRIGAHSFIGGASRVVQDVVPFVRATGNPLRVAGLNSIGLERRGFSAEAIATLKRAYRTLFRDGLNVTQALEKLRAEAETSSEVAALVAFVERSDRGISTARARGGAG